MEGKDLNIVLVLKSGGRYTIDDALLLSFYLRKFQGEHNAHIFCLNDILKKNITLWGVKFIPLPDRWRHWWSKMNLFSPVLHELRPFLFFDLDTMILDDYTSVIPSDLNIFVTLEDFYQKGKLASGAMWIPHVDVIDAIWKDWTHNPKFWMRSCRGDQEYLRNIVPSDSVTFFQSYTDMFQSMKPPPKCRPLQEMPKNKAVVCLHGRPGIIEAGRDLRWVHYYIMGWKDAKNCRKK